MTAMCVLSKISGLQDKIRVTETYDAIVRREGRRSRVPRAKEREAELEEEVGDDFFKWDKNKREIRDDNKLTIKIGLERTEMEREIEIGNVRGKGEGAEIIDYFKNRSAISVAETQSNDATELENYDRPRRNPRHRFYAGIYDMPPHSAVPPKRDSDRISGGIGPAVQHWESMIGTANARYLQYKIRCSNDYAGDEVEQQCKWSIPTDGTSSLKSSQCPPKVELLARGYRKTMQNTLDNEPEKNNHSNVAMGAAKDKKPMEMNPSQGGKLKRMAFNLFDIFAGNKRNSNRTPSPMITDRNPRR